MQKILELKGDDLMKGLSLQKNLPVGGLWRLAEYYSPFKKMGVLTPTLAAVEKYAGQLALPLKSLCFYKESGKAYLFGFGNRLANGKAAYKINITDDTIEDYSSYAHNGLTTETPLNTFCTQYGGRILYDQNSNPSAVRSFSASDGSDDQAVISSGFLGSSLYIHPFVIGPDGYGYIGNGRYIGYIKTANGTTDNSATKHDTGYGFYVKDLDQDGRYLIVGIDDNPTNIQGVQSNCQVIFWDVANARTTAEVRWPIIADYITGVKYLDGWVYVYANNGVHICNFATEPRLFYPYTSESVVSAMPLLYNQIAKDGHSIYWIDPDGTSGVHALGNPIAGQPKIFYNPYSTGGANQNALALSSSNIFASTSDSKLFKLNSGASDTVQIENVAKDLLVPYTFDFAKINLKSRLSAGQSITFKLLNAAEETISAAETKTYETGGVGAKKTLIFHPKAEANQQTQFTDLYMYLSTNADIASIEIFGSPVSAANQI